MSKTDPRVDALIDQGRQELRRLQGRGEARDPERLSAQLDDRTKDAVLGLLRAREGTPWMDQWVVAALAAADAADRAAGVVRVDTRDEALVERLVDVAAESLRSGCPVPMCRGTHRADARLVVRAALAALREES